MVSQGAGEPLSGAQGSCSAAAAFRRGKVCGSFGPRSQGPPSAPGQKWPVDVVLPLLGALGSLGSATPRRRPLGKRPAARDPALACGPGFRADVALRMHSPHDTLAVRAWPGERRVARPPGWAVPGTDSRARAPGASAVNWAKSPGWGP